MNRNIGVIIHQPLQDKLFHPAQRQGLEALGEVRWTEATEPLDEASAAALLADCAVAVGSWKTARPTAELLAKCPQLRLWEHAAGTVKPMFGSHLEGRDLVIGSCAPAIAENVAEMVLGVLIVGLKRLFPNAQDNRVGPRVPKPENAKVLLESTIGVVGASQVGRRVIRNLRPNEPAILLYDPYVSEGDAFEMGAKKVHDLAELCAASDAVTLHTPNVPATKGLIGARELAAMRDDTVFVNTSRGECVDEAALIAELSKGRLFAFLDVTFPEPAAPESPLRKLPNVMLTSHIAGGANFRIGQQVVEDVAAFFEGRSPAMAVTAEMLDRLA